VKKSIRRKDE